MTTTTNNAMNPTPLFLNISNHPLSTWTDAQKAAAGCEIQDIPFPLVPPTASHDDVQDMADEIAVQALEFRNHGYGPITAHIMGDMTLTYALVSRLKAEGIMCVESTTLRKVIDNPDGSKTSYFNFVRFREY